MSIRKSIDISIIRDIGETIRLGNIGIEKESLRVIDSAISQSRHPENLGSSLFNKYITTDFSEAQLEFITPPNKKNVHSIKFLQDIHHFVFHNIGDEYLWPCSIPPYFKSESNIRIADYGKSNMGLFKKYYRKGLSSRYGRFMQTISGVHFNYSLPGEIFNNYSNDDFIETGETIESIGYFKMLRSIFRMNWLLLYLFGASPIISKNFLSTKNDSFEKLDQNNYYLPYATSLRMSNYGYQNARRSNLKISSVSLTDYLNDLIEATNKVSERYKYLDTTNINYDIQLNSNTLQIEDEYYAIARPKSSLINDEKLSVRLRKTGVNYIELRSLDLNPFSRVGIDKETIDFLEIFLIYCYLKPSRQLKNYETCLRNDSLTALEGRRPGLILVKEDKEVLLYDWAQEILDEMELIAEQLVSNDFKIAINLMRERVADNKKTLSAMMMERVLDQNIGFTNFSNEIALSNKNYFLKKKISENLNLQILEKEIKKSNNKQIHINSITEESFASFLQKKSL